MPPPALLVVALQYPSLAVGFPLPAAAAFHNPYLPAPHPTPNNSNSLRIATSLDCHYYNSSQPRLPREYLPPLPRANSPNCAKSKWHRNCIVDLEVGVAFEIGTMVVWHRPNCVDVVASHDLAADDAAVVLMARWSLVLAAIDQCNSEVRIWVLMWTDCWIVMPMQTRRRKIFLPVCAAFWIRQTRQCSNLYWRARGAFGEPLLRS
mmetsp:Transcript_14506/g.24810  ORF Transcript_14506/g.24810 Transcript_14506/m.24810 type:complete len:206 (-) Transcript_14506:128-745(-)